MKPIKLFALTAVAALLLSASGCSAGQTGTPTDPPTEESTPLDESTEIVDILLSDDGVVCDSEAVYTANDIIYYEDGHDDTYGEGDESDAHSAAEADSHTVVHITKPGTYRVAGRLSAGQLFVDLGEDAKSDPEARVTLILDGADITCTVAPAVFFYRVYECCDDEEVTLTPDLSNAGAVVELADGSENTVNGSYVARIYKEGTTKKLHKYDGAFYSKMSLRMEGNTGSLTVNAENEGLDSELHLELNGGNITINAFDDGINTNEDGISVTTLNGGTLTVTGGLGDEGDGIDSNGALVINGGTLLATANPRTGDGGIDADTGIYLNGGTVIATGSRNDNAEADSKQQYMELTFAQTVKEGSEIALLNGEETVFSFTATRDFSSLTVSFLALSLDVPYTLTVDGVVQQNGGTQNAGIPGEFPADGDVPALPDGMSTPPQGSPNEAERPSDGVEPPEKPDGEMPGAPDGEMPTGEKPEMPEMPAVSDGNAPEKPEGEEPPALPQGGMGGFAGNVPTEVTTEFTLTSERHSFYSVRDAEI